MPDPCLPLLKALTNAGADAPVAEGRFSQPKPKSQPSEKRAGPRPAKWAGIPTGFAFDRRPGSKRLLANAMENDPHRTEPSEQRIARGDFLEDGRLLTFEGSVKRLKQIVSFGQNGRLEDVPHVPASPTSLSRVFPIFCSRATR